MPAADGSLARWRVLVTRPREQSLPFAEALAAAGATPIVYPTIALAPPPSWQPLDDALARLDGYDWAIFTSPSAVAFTLDRGGARGLPAGAFSRIRIAAVGDETARALRERGLVVALVPAAEQQRQEGLVDALRGAALAPPAARPSGPIRVLFPQAIGGRELLRDELTRGGYAVDVVAVSQTLALDLADPPPPFDVATFASPSALRAFVEGLGGESLARAQVAVIGPTTAQAATALRVRVDAMPGTPNVAALVQSLIDLRARLDARPRR